MLSETTSYMKDSGSPEPYLRKIAEAGFYRHGGIPQSYEFELAGWPDGVRRTATIAIVS